MTPDVIAELQKEEPTATHDALLQDALRCVKTSRGVMSKFYPDWDMQDQVYRGEVCLDQEDVRQASEGKPTKMVVPNTFAQVMTFSSFLFLMFNQNRTFFELTPTGEEDFGTKQRDIETILQQNWRFNQGNTLLFQHLLDIARFGPGILECCWSRKVTRAYVTPDPQQVNFGGVTTEVRGQSDWQEFVKYEGNIVRSVSPYRFFPDTSFPLDEAIRKGKYCFAEEDFTVEGLRELEKAGEVAGIDHIQGLPRNWQSTGGGPRRAVTDLASIIGSKFDPTKGASPVIVTKGQRWLVPKDFKLANDKPLGPEEFPVLYHIWYANDNRVIRCEPAYWWHNEFGWTVGQFTPDMHRTLTMGLADLVYKLQEVISWFVNAHITSVRRVMQNRLIVDPRVVDTTTLDGEGDIYLRKGASMPLDRAVGQLKVQDVTGGHMTDVQLLGTLMEVVTGVNGNAMGQYNSGRRAAREVAVVSAGSAGRMKMHGHLIWEASLGRIGRLMLSNCRQATSNEIFNRIIGDTAAQDPTRYLAFKGTPEEIVCGGDYFMFDGTTTSEKGFMAQSLEGLLQGIISNPVAAQQLNLDPQKMLAELQWLRGGGPISRFSLQRNVAGGVSAPLPPVALPQPAVG